MPSRRMYRIMYFGEFKVERITKQKILKNGKIYYFLPKRVIERLKGKYNDPKYRWKFPEIEFKENYVITEYIENTIWVKFKTVLFILKNLILGSCFIDDLPRNIRGVLIDFEDVEVVPRFQYFMKLVEFSWVFKLFKKYYLKIYTKNYQILSTDPLVIRNENEIMVLDEEYEIDSCISKLNKNKERKGKYYHLIEKYGKDI